MKHSIVEMISNRIVYHTGGSNGPGNNSDGSGDEHADGSRSSNGSFGGSSDGGGGSDRERPKPTLEKANVVDAGLEESREVKSSLNAQAKNFQEFAGYAGPGRELSPGDIDPDTGREVSSVDDNGRPTGYTDAAGDNSSDTPSAYAGPGRELSPGDIDPDNGRVVSEVDDYGRPTKYDDSGVGNGTSDRQFSPGEIDPETGRVVAEVDDYGRPTKYENPQGTVGPGTVDPDIPSDEEIPGYTVQEDGSIVFDPIVVTEDDVPHQDEYPGGDGGANSGSGSGSGSNSPQSTVSDWHTAFSMLQTVSLETLGFISKVVEEYPEAAKGLKSFTKYAKYVGGPYSVIAGPVIEAGLAVLEGKSYSEVMDAAEKGLIGGGIGLVGAAVTLGLGFAGVAVAPAALVGMAIGIGLGLADASFGLSGSLHDAVFDPVLLDLSNDDFQLIDLAESAAMFDYDADSFLENVGWVSGDDGILAIDLDGSGLIDAAAEFVFAGETEAEDTDLEALAELYDSNNDGVLNAEDAQWSQFRVWQDWNGDGQSQEGEVSTLEELNIAEIGLVSNGVEEEIEGNTIHGRATFTREDGTTGDVGDVSFQASAFGYRDTEEGTEIGDGNTLVLSGDEDQKRDIADGNYDGLITGGGDDTLVNSAGRDAFLSSGAGDDTLVGGDGNDWLLGGDGADTLAGGHGHDILFADAADSIDGGDGFDVVLGQGDGDLDIDLGQTRTEAVYGAEGDDHLRAGDARDVTIDGGAGDDQVIGGAGDDLLSGGSGADTLIGGSGDDTLIIDEFDALHGGAGQDRVIFMGDADLDINITDYGVEIFNAGGGDDIIRTDQAVAAAIDGGEGNDTVFGGWGADWLSGGHGDDSLLGGFGNDTYAFGRGDGAETIHDYSHNTRIDTIYDLYSDGSKKNVRTRTVDIHENAGEDQIVFGASIDPDDLLIKADGQDILIALKDPNNPDASFDELDDQLRLVNWQDERDRVEKITFSSGTSLDLNAMLQNLGFIGDGTVLDVGAAMITKLGEYADGIGEGGIGLAGTSEGEALLGSDQDDVVVAGAGHDVIGGGAGNDQLYGQDGDDILSGGEGSDLLDGGAGDDIIISDGNDTIIGGDGNDSLKFFNENGVQVDLSDAEIENVLGSMGDDELSAIGLEDAIYMDGESGNDTLISGGGNDTLLGDFGDDVLDGGAGDDRLVGGAGDDRFIGNEGTDTMLGGDGQDIVDYSGSDQGVELSLETGGTSGDAAGDTFDGIENVIGTNQDDVIAGDGADNTLDAGAGDDSLFGQDGDDHLLAGDGNDILDGGQGDDVLEGGAGADQLSGGDGQDQLTGGAGDDVLDGGDGTDVLDGGTGDDHLTGGAGADHLSGGEGNDVLDAGEGVDLVDAGAGDDTIIGRGDGDVINGGAGSDLLDYGQSDDGVRLDMSDTKGYEADHLEDQALNIETVSGSAFNDDLAGSALNETFEAGVGDDTVSGRLGDDELSGGAGDDTLLGQQGDDVLHGGSGDDILSGGSGDDTLYGGEGDNLLFGGEGDDEAVFAGSRDDYDFVRDGDDLIVIGAEGETRLSDIETIRFDDEVFNVEDLLADEDIPVATENRQRRDEQYQTALAASVASAVALGGLASTYDNTAQAAERIEAAAANDPDIAEENIWVVEPLQSDEANAFVAGASGDDLLAEEPDGAEGGPIPGGGVLSGASSASGVVNGSSAGGYEADILSEMMGNVQSDVPVNDDGGSVSGEPGTTVNSLSPAEDVETATIITRDELPEPNFAPEGVADFAQALEDQEIRIRISDLLANDSDPENGILEFAGIGSVTGGIVRVEGGYVIFSPARDFNGFASVSYRIRDNYGNIATAQLGIDVAEVNDAPSVVGEYVSGREDTVLRIALQDLLANDIDVDGDMLSITAITEVSSGSAEIDGDDLVFTPAPDWNGEAILRYAVSDGRGGQSIATVRIDVAAVNDAPDLQDDVLQTDEDQVLQLNVSELLANDSDREGDALAVTGVEAVSGGTVGLSGDTITFTPDANFNGTARFKYQVDDGNGGVSTAFADVSVAAVNDAPVIEVIPDTRTHYHQAFALTAFVSASDIDGDALYIELRDAESLGHFEVDGQAVPDQSIVRVLLSEIDRVRFVPVAYPDSVETLQIRAFDGEIYTDWKPLAVTADNTVLGTEGADELMAGNIGDILDGFAGNDTLTGGSGDDLLLGRDGDDTLLGGAGNDTLYGGEGDDTIVAGAGNNSIWAGDGNDRIEISNLDDLTRLDAGDGRDRLVLQTSEDVTLDISTVYAEEIEAGAGNDVLYSNGAEDLYIHAGDGDDVLLGGDGNDTLIGGAGKDQIEGGAGDDVIEIGLGDNLADIDGGSGNDTLMVSDGVDITIDMTGTGIENVVGGAGNETVTDLAAKGANVSLGDGDDTVIAGSGADILEGGAGSDTLDYSQSTGGISINLAENSVTGGTGDGDTISGFENVNDTVFDDLIIGDAEDNRLLSSSGNDDLTGDDGADEFVINLDPSATGTVRIRDFSPINGDMLSLTGLGAAGTIAAITNALASQTMNEDGDVTLSFADGRSVIFEGLGEPFTSEMTTAPVVVAEETISDERTGELKVRVALSRAVDEDLEFGWEFSSTASNVEDGHIKNGTVEINSGSLFGEQFLNEVSNFDLYNFDSGNLKIISVHGNSNNYSIDSNKKLFSIGNLEVLNEIDSEIFSIEKYYDVSRESFGNFGKIKEITLPSFGSGAASVFPVGIGQVFAESRAILDVSGIDEFLFDYKLEIYSTEIYGNFRSYYRIISDEGNGEWVSAYSSVYQLYSGHTYIEDSISVKFNDLFEKNDRVEVKVDFYLDTVLQYENGQSGVNAGGIQIEKLYGSYSKENLVYGISDINLDSIDDAIYYNNDLGKYELKFGGVNDLKCFISNDLMRDVITVFGANVETSEPVALFAVGDELRILRGSDAVNEITLSDLDSLAFEQNIVAATGAVIDSSGRDSLIIAIGENDTISEIQIIRTDGAETLKQDHVAGAQRIIVPEGTYTGLANLGDTNGDGIEELGLVSSNGVTRIEQSVLLRDGDFIQLGSSADDTLVAVDNAVISGLNGDDDYSIQTGVGDVTIVNEGSSLADHDRIVFGDGVSAEQLWFTRNGNDLLLEVLGTDDSVTMADWYGGDLSAKIDAITLQDGSELAGYEIEKIVSLMAAIDKPEDLGAATETLANAGLTDDVEELWAAG